MHHLVALLAGCFLYPPADDLCHDEREAQYEFLRNHGAREVQWSENGAVRSMKPTGIFIRTGIDEFQVGQPAPELLEKLGPALLARGTEELRVTIIDRHLPHHVAQGNVIHLSEFIRGREVIRSWVTVILDEKTNEVILMHAEFLPDRGFVHEPRLTAAEAKVKLDAALREFPYQDLNVTFLEAPARLAYSFEEWGSMGGLGGALVWVFSVRFPPAGGEMQFGELNVDAVTGRMAPRENRY